MEIPGLHKSFTRKNGVLHAEGVSLEKLAAKHDTPLFVYSRQAIEERCREITAAFAAPRCRAFFSVKCNGNQSILRLVRRTGMGADIVSGGELFCAKQAGFKGEDIVFAGVGKRDEEIAAALRFRIKSFNVESIPELKKIDKIARRLNRKARISIRVNPDIDAKTHKHITTGTSANKFGLLIKVALRAGSLIKEMKGVELNGLHFHIGSQITDPGPFVRTAKYAKKCVAEFGRIGLGIKVLNFGGGFGVSYDGKQVTPVSVFAREILAELVAIDQEVFIEPGRYIAAPSALLLTRVVFRKEAGKRVFLILDAGMNDLIRPVLYQAYHQIEPVRQRPGSKKKVDVVGPICETGDTFARERLLPRVEEGDLLALTCAGAYCASMASNYNARPRPAEVMVNGRRVRVIRRRESYRDLVKLEE